MTRQLEDFRKEIVALIGQHSENRDFNTLLNALLSDISDLSGTRFDVREVMARMFGRLNTDDDGNPLPNLYDSRPFSPAFQVFGPIASAQADLADFIAIMRHQVFVYTADGANLDDLGRDFDFPRFQASRAIRIGHTWDVNGNLADFPIGSRLASRDTQNPIIFEVYETNGGDVLFRHLPDPNEDFVRGDIGNTYFGDLSPASPINGLGRATITGTYAPGQNRETDEAYRRRFLRFLRRQAFGGNVAQYQAEVARIDGVGDTLVFPVWRGEGTVRIFVVDTNNEPVSDEFVGMVQEAIDPLNRSGTGFGGQIGDALQLGIAPVGHRVTISTPQWVDVDIVIPVVLSNGITEGQVRSRFEDILHRHFANLRQSVVDEWERTYYANIGITTPLADMRDDINTLDGFMRQSSGIFAAGGLDVVDAYGRMMTLMTWFPTQQHIQAHNFETIIHPQVLGTELLATRLVSAVNFSNIEINGQADVNGFVIGQSQDMVYLPRQRNYALVIS